MGHQFEVTIISHGDLAKMVTIERREKVVFHVDLAAAGGGLGFSSLNHIENTSQGQCQVFDGRKAVRTQLPLQGKRMDTVWKGILNMNLTTYVPCLSPENFSPVSSFILVLLLKVCRTKYNTDSRRKSCICNTMGKFVGYYSSNLSQT